MDLKVAVAPVEEPSTLADVKTHLRVDVDNDNALIYLYQKAARQICEDVARRSFITRTYDLYLDGWWDGELKLPMPPLQSVTGVYYYNQSNTQATLAAANYVVNAGSEPGKIVWSATATIPNVTLKPTGGVCIRYVAGYGNADTVPDHYKAAVLLVIGHLYENRENVGFQSAYKLPLGAESILMMDRGWR